MVTELCNVNAVENLQYKQERRASIRVRTWYDGQTVLHQELRTMCKSCPYSTHTNEQTETPKRQQKHETYLSVWYSRQNPSP
jgi:hypothetical protein